MTTKKRATSKSGLKKLKVKKETIKDLDASRGEVKGGTLLYTGACRAGAQTLGLTCGAGAQTLKCGAQTLGCGGLGGKL